MIDEADAGMVGELAEHGGAKAADAECDAEEHARDQSEAVRHQFLREHDDRRRRRREDEADENCQHGACGKAGIGQRQRERQRPENGEPDDVFAAEAIAERPAEERTRCVGGKEDEEIELGCLHRHLKLVDQIEDVIARQARHVELFRE